jgi:ABC-type branched-subunit amino acid transport system permease subunit
MVALAALGGSRRTWGGEAIGAIVVVSIRSSWWFRRSVNILRSMNPRSSKTPLTVHPEELETE